METSATIEHFFLDENQEKVFFVTIVWDFNCSRNE